MRSKLTMLICLPAMLSIASSASAQSLFKTIDSLDINNIKASALVHGDMWHDTNLAYAICNFPANTQKRLASSGGLWMAGYDNGGQLKAAAVTFRQDSSDYWPGPLSGNTAITYSASGNWAKIWKINRTDIQAFLAISNHTTTNTPAVILEWPAKGNPNAKGNNNASLTITTDMAPFVDVNGDGSYNALQGDYPAMKGDQALWWVFNDNGPGLHTVTKTSPLGFEIRAMAYGYKRNNVMDNVLYYEYDIRNKSGLSYDSLRIGLFADVEIGHSFTDYIGFDSSHRMGIAYSGMVNIDSMRMAGISLVDMTGDNCTSHAPAGSFMYYNNDFTLQGNPVNGIEFSNLLSAHFRGGAALPGNARYAYTDDPSIPGGNSECAQNTPFNDRRFVIATPPYSLAAGGSLRVTYALIADAAYNACPGVTFNGIKALADSVWNYYCAPPPNTGIAGTATEKKTLKIYPNPAQQSIFIETQSNNGSAIIYDALGKMYNLPVAVKNNTIELDIHSLAPGVYTILYRDNNTRRSGVFVKE